MSDVKLFQGDCLEVMQDLIDDGVKVDLVLTDPPYNMTLCKWDNIIPFEQMWEKLNKLTYDNTPILLFGSETFSSHLRLSNEKYYKYDWIWEKHRASNFIQCNKRPLKYHELISVFYKKQPVYNKQMIKRESERVLQAHNTGWKMTSRPSSPVSIGGGLEGMDVQSWDPYLKNPSQIIKFPALVNNSNEKVGHPTQKPVKLLKYLIKTYTNENDLVLDFTMGSGSTGVACIQTNRNFIGIELEPKYYEIAEQRIKEAKAQRRLI